VLLPQIEFLDYFKTALPQLMNNITRGYCEEHKGDYGWLVHEYEPPVMALMCAKAIQIIQRLWGGGDC
jgi:hypothetical protein